MNKKKMTIVMEMIAQDQMDDAKNFEGKPFNGRTVAEYFGNQGAAIATMANIIKELINEIALYNMAVEDTLENEEEQ